jgi:ribose transport system ATP-binding protein
MTVTELRPPLLRMVGIVKEFPGVRALDGVELDVVPGEVHCLLGQNGAGKSTLIKVLSGAHHPDAGTITWQGQQVKLANPMAAMRLGIATIYQELQGALRTTRPSGHLKDPRGRSTQRGWQTNRQHGASTFSRGTPHRDGRTFGRLDEGEVRNLFRIICDLQASDVATIYISHRLEEIREIGDRVTVLKDGRTVAEGLPVRTTSKAEVITLMTGRSIEYVFPERSGVAPDAPELLRVEGLSRTGEFENVSFTVRGGEIVGLAGLVGSGRSEILETLTEPARHIAARCGSTEHEYVPAQSLMRSGPVLGSGRKSARARRSSWASRCIATSRSRPWNGSPLARSRVSPMSYGPPKSRCVRWTCVRTTPCGRCATCPAATNRRSSLPGGSCAAAAYFSWMSQRAASTLAHELRSIR